LPGEGKRGPFSFAHRADIENGMSRPNPLIDRGHIASAFTGARGRYRTMRVTVEASAQLEAAWHAPASTSKFTQFTLDQRSAFGTFLDQRIETSAHLVVTSGDMTPRQRYAYLGGSRTLPTLDLLTLGGDRLFFADVGYVIPIRWVNVPMLGQPSIQPRFAVGAAGVGKFGVPVRNVGARLALWVFQLDYMVDPKSHRHAFDVGIQLPL
jgi:hypothetical protein